MQFQLTRQRLVSTVLIGTLALAVGSFYSQPAAAQLSRSAFREAARELNLSRSQMRDVAGIMRSFSAEVQDILTPEQFEQLQAVREQQQEQSSAQAPDPQELREDLNLTEAQAEQIAATRTETVAELQEILTPEQISGMMEMVGFNQL